jgi:hypothetical protein
MGMGDLLKSVLWCGKGDKEASLTLADPLQQELESYSGLARARAPFQQVHMFLREAAPEDII